MKDELTGEVGTFDKPDQPAVGARTLLVNGVPVAAEREPITGAAPGQSTRRAPDIVM